MAPDSEVDMMEGETIEWHTARFTSTERVDETGDGLFAVVVLNQPIEMDFTLFQNIWTRGFPFEGFNKAKIRVCADGGANRVYDLNQVNSIQTVPYTLW
jgi:hypothetical protein